MQLLCKTRGDSLPTGKARVYFFAHSEDYKLFFDEICRDILDVANCSIWYKPDSSEYIDDDLELTLGQMQLIVIPITNRFLSDSNLINSKEFVFIREKRIPILPILQETDILESYNKIFSNVQFMSRFDLDNTSIPFSKKLERFLKSVLLEDETIEQIKSEFDAHVFVSYRKKDRKYANEFIKLMHENDKLEDVGVWYDEFLTPGENFNYEIEQEIDKCDVFSVVITPNVVNELNYIITTEYPIAKARGKYIFPVELVETNKQSVFDALDDIPELVNVHDKPVFDSSLIDALSYLNVKNNDFLPEHKYLIGLAYLFGIDVEVNTEKGITILTKCSEYNYLPAIEKLVDIYHRGHGVSIDYDKAIAYQNTIIEIKKDKASPDNQDEYLDYVGSICNCASLLIEIYRLNQAIEKLEEAIKLLSLIDESKLNGKTLYYYNLCYNKLAFCYSTENEMSAAAKSYRKAKDLMERCYSNHIESAGDYLAEVYNNLGTLFLKAGDLEYAKDYIESAFSIQNHSHGESVRNKEDNAYVMAIMYSNLGAIADYNGEASLDYYDKAMELIKRFLIDKQKLPYYRVAFVVCFRAGIECTKLNEFEDAKAWFSEAIGYIEQVLKQSDAVEDYSDKANCYSHIAKLNHAQGKIEEELSCYKESIDLLNKVLSKADFPECRRSIYKGNMAIASTLLEKQMDRAESKNSNDLEMTEEELYDIREHYLRAINVMIPIIEKCLNATMAPTEDGKAHITLEMIDDIKDVAEAWRILSYVDRHRIPIEKGILMYSWLKRIDPDNNEYDNCIEELTKMLDEVE